MCPHTLSATLTELLATTREAHPFWGARKLLAVLQARHAIAAQQTRARIHPNRTRKVMVPGAAKGYAFLGRDCMLMQTPPASRPGFSLLELMVVVLIGGIVMTTGAVTLARGVRGVNLNQASQVIASDLRVAVSLAARQQKPVRIECVCASRRLRVVDRATGTVLMTRDLAAETLLGVSTLALATADSSSGVTVFPSGITSSPLTVTIGNGAMSRTVTLSIAGSVRTQN